MARADKIQHIANNNPETESLWIVCWISKLKTFLQFTLVNIVTVDTHSHPPAFCCLADSKLNTHQVLNCSSDIIKDHCFWPLLSDLINLMSHKPVALAFMEDSTLMNIWFELIGFLQGTQSIYYILHYILFWLATAYQTSHYFMLMLCLYVDELLFIQTAFQLIESWFCCKLGPDLPLANQFSDS